MYAQIEKSKENKTKTVGNYVAQKKSGVQQGFGFVDNRSEAIAQRKLEEIASVDFYKEGATNTTTVIQRNSYDVLKSEKKPFIFKKNIRPYEDKEQFGHTFSIELGIEDPEQLLWLEKTNKPYLESMQRDTWNNMAGLAHDSNVFSDWNSIVGTPGYQIIQFVDPPSIMKTPNNHRILEFYIHIIGNDNNDMITLTARQELQTDGDGEISKSSFSFLDEKVYKSGSSEDTELSNPYWDED